MPTIFKRGKVIQIVIFISGTLAGILLFYFYDNPLRQNKPQVAVREGGYNFINPLLACDFSEDKKFDAYDSIQKKFAEFINQKIISSDATNISIYFRGLNSGWWSGVNENETYVPASLIKVPMMIAYLKEADVNPNILQKRLTYHQKIDANSSEFYKPNQSITDGNTYTVNDLLKYMIMYSDNNAFEVLQENVSEQSLTDVYSDLGIPVSNNIDDPVISPKQYAYIFRILYNATYLSKPMSQYALELLSYSDFTYGIRSGIPTEMPSAQKFGERTVYNRSGNTMAVSERELHDCGIVYYPKNPYLICVMTRGGDFTKLANIISGLSAIVYQETNSGVLKI